VVEIVVAVVVVVVDVVVVAAVVVVVVVVVARIQAEQCARLIAITQLNTIIQQS
jgi:hypothetical protein